MEHAPLRPVPSRPAGPVDPASAAREVAAVLPALSPLEARALALVALADRPRAEAAATLGIDERELAGALSFARKELRRTVATLGGSGWCERAEGLVSDRLDGALREADAPRLDAHLRNCPRCVEHERRLVQATDALLAGLAGPARPGPAPAKPLGPLVAVPHEAEPEDGAVTDEAPLAASEPRSREELATTAGWRVLVAIALILMIAAIALAVAGILGAHL